MRALELIAEGYRPSEAARVLGVTPGAVSQWQKRARDGGTVALLRRKPKGRPRRLDDAQLAELGSLLAPMRDENGALRITTRQIVALVDRTFGVRLSRAQISRLLRTCVPLEPANKRAAPRRGTASGAVSV